MKDFTNERKKANRAVVFSCRPFPNILKYKDQFHQKLIDRQTEYELIVPNFLFAEPNKFILVKIPFSISNENTVKRFLDKLQSFAYHKFDIAVKWFTKSEVCFVCKIKICTLLVKSMKFVPIQQITLVKQNKMSRHGGINTRIQIKILNQLNTSEKFLIISSIGKYVSRHLQTRNYIRSWNHQW